MSVFNQGSLYTLSGSFSTKRLIPKEIFRCFSQDGFAMSIIRTKNISCKNHHGLRRGIIDLLVKRSSSQVRLRHDCPLICKISAVLRLC